VIGLLLTVALSVSVSPRIAFAPATVQLRVRVDADPTARRLVVALVSADHAQTSDWPIPPCDRKACSVPLPAWQRVPAGDYEIVVAVVDGQGHITAREVTTVHIEPGLGQ
jgi:methionine-rich copper-binding protein CopC